MPLAEEWNDQRGISRAARESYYKKMRTLVQGHHFAVVDFENHDEGSAFLDRQQNHLTGKGWLFYNRVLDDFFHGRVPRA
jgi:D-alanine transfer protein